MAAALVDATRVDEAIDLIAVDDPAFARYVHAITHLTVSPNTFHAGAKVNVIPDGAFADIDVRALPGMDRAFVNTHLRRAAGEAAERLETIPLADHPATVSSRGNPLWDAIVSGIEDHTGSREVVPAVMSGFTDARFWRAKGTIAYGVGLYDDATDFGDFLSRFHGHDERVSLESVDLTAGLLHTVLAGFGARTST
ncbi:hypothetical protein BH23ACT5_BH23ACT5_00810 [soil metagenome]